MVTDIKTSFIKRTILIVIIGSVGVISCNAQSIGEKFNEARKIYLDNEPKKAYKIYDSIWSSNESILLKDKVNAGRIKAKLDWRLFDQHEKALTTIEKAEKLSQDVTRLLILKARILEDQKKFKEALRVLDTAVKKSESITDNYDSQLAYFSLILELNLNGSEKWKYLLPKAYKKVEEFEDQNFGDAIVAKLSLGFNLLRGDGVKAFKNWMFYYRKVTIDQIDHSLIKDPISFKKALSVDDIRTSSQMDLSTIILGLAESGFIDYAELVKTRYLLPKGVTLSKELKEITYLREFFSNVKTPTVEHYRGTPEAFKNRNAYYNKYVPEFQEKIYEEAKNLWKKLGMIEANFTEANFTEMLRKRFKTDMLFLYANNINGFHLGQIIYDANKKIIQHGHSAIFSHRVLDHTIFNGFSQWYTDGSGQVGGWQLDGVGYFVQVRSGHTLTNPTRFWLMITDKKEYASTLKEIEGKEKIDNINARKNPLDITNAILTRVRVEEYEKILDSLKTIYNDKKMLRLAFESEAARLITESNIYAHEGRHGIDRSLGIKSGKELEFRGKLSEVYFSSKPKLALGNFIIGSKDTTHSHGWGNYKVASGIIDWMKKYPNKIKGLNINNPLLPQAYKLTDKQLKQIMYELDPLTKK